MSDNTEIYNSLFKLEQYVNSNDYSGYDPYDALNSIKLESINNKYIKIFLTQIFVYSPLNFRNFFKINPEKNPKAIGLFLQSYCKLYNKGFIEKKKFDNISKKFYEFLIKNRSDGYSNHCWGFSTYASGILYLNRE